MTTLGCTTPYRLKAMTTLIWPVLCTLTTDAPSFLLSLAGRNPWVSVAMARMYQKPENCRGMGEGHCQSCHTMMPVQAPRQTDRQTADPVSDSFPRPRPHLYLQGSATLSQARLDRSRCLAG